MAAIPEKKMSMQTGSETHTLDSKRERVATILRLVSWLGLWGQIVLGAAGVLTLAFAITGRSFNQALTPTLGIPGAVNLRSTLR